MDDLQIGDLVECISNQHHAGERGTITVCLGNKKYWHGEGRLPSFRTAYIYVTSFLKSDGECLPRQHLRKIIDDGKEPSNWETGVWKPKDLLKKEPNTCFPPPIKVRGVKSFLLLQSVLLFTKEL